MKQFNSQEYLNNPSRKVVTRDGRSVRILCTDAKTEYPVVALFTCCKNSESLMCYKKDGTRMDDVESVFDLFFSPERIEGWVNIYRSERRSICCGYFYETEEKAIKEISNKSNDVKHIATVKLEWEEEL